MKNKQIVTGTILNYAVLAVQAVSAILITPFIISTLGNGTFGVYKIVSSLIAYMGILNFGFGNAVIRFLTEIKVQQDLKKENEFLSVIKLLNLVAGIVVVVAGILLYTAIPSIFGHSLTPQEITLAQQMFIVLIVSVVINVFNDIYTAIITVHERFIFSKGLDLFRCTFRIFLIFAILTFQPSAVALTAIDLLLSIFAFLCNVIFCRKKLNTKPKYSFHVLKTLDRAYYKVVLVYAAYYFLNLIVDQLIWNTDSVVIGMRLSANDAAIYGAGSTISTAFYSLSLVIGVLMFPKVVRLVSSGATREQLTTLMISLGRFQAFISLFIFTLYLSIGRQFVTNLWLDESYLGAWTTSLIIMFGSLFNSLTAAGHLILRALNRQKFFLFTYLGIFIANAIITYLCVVYYGIVGAAVTTTISFAVGISCLIIPYYHKVIGINIPAFLKKMLPPVIISAIFGLTFFFVFSQFPIDTWLKLAGAAVVYTVAYYTAMYFLVADKAEKLQISAMFARMTSKFRRN